VDELLLLLGVVEPGLLLEELDHLGVDRLVDGRRPLTHPRPALDAVAGVDDPAVHPRVAVPVLHLVLPIGVLFEGHEDERRQLQAAVDDLEGGPGVAAADPRVLDERHVLEGTPTDSRSPSQYSTVWSFQYTSPS